MKIANAQRCSSNSVMNGHCRSGSAAELLPQKLAKTIEYKMSLITPNALIGAERDKEQLLDKILSFITIGCE